MNCNESCNYVLLANERNSISDLQNGMKLYLEKKENFRSIFGILACPVKDKFVFRPFFINSKRDEDELVSLMKEVSESGKEKVIQYVTGKPKFMEKHLSIKCRDFFGLQLSGGEYVRYFNPVKYEIFAVDHLSKISAQYEDGKQ